MTFYQLVYVDAVARYGSINKAAQNLFLSQSSLSKSIKRLEKELSITIFIRKSNGVSITEEGLQFLQDTKFVLSQFNQIKDAYIKKDDPIKTLRITTSRHSFVTKCLIEFYKEHFREKDRVQINIKESPPQNVYIEVLNGTADIGIVSLPQHAIGYWTTFLESQNIVQKLLFFDNECIMLNKNHPLLSQRKITMRDLKRYPLIQSLEKDTPAPNFNKEIELLEYKFFPQKIYTDSRSIIYNMLSYSDAIFFATTNDSVSDLFPDVTSIYLPESIPELIWGHYFIVRKDKQLTAEEKLFLGFLQKKYAEQ